MKILAINTTNKNGIIFCGDEKKCVMNRIENPYSEHIMQSVQNVLKDAKLELSDIDSIGIVTGPGSFTGIRIGMAVVKGMMCAKKFNAVAINSFELISYNISSENYIVLLDSGNQEHYYAIFKNKKVDEFGHGTIDEIKQFALKQNLQIYFDKNESKVFENIEGLIPVEVTDDTLFKITRDKTMRQEFTSIQNLSPIYIKLSQAEIGLEQKMAEHCHYRKAEESDANALYIIDEQCFDGNIRYDEKSFNEELSEKSKKYFVAVYDNLVIGYVGLQKLGDDLNLLKIAVLPQYRKLGVGFKLMQIAIDYRVELKAQNFFLEVSEKNTNAIKLYQKFGFKTKSTRDHYYSDGSNALVMFTK